MPPVSPNPDPTLDQKMKFSTLIFRPDPYPFSDLVSKIHTHFQTWLLGTNFVIISHCKLFLSLCIKKSIYVMFILYLLDYGVPDFPTRVQQQILPNK